MKRLVTLLLLLALLLPGCGSGDPAPTTFVPGEPVSFTAFVVEGTKTGYLVQVADPKDTYFLPSDLVAVTTDLADCVPGEYLKITYDSNLDIPYPWAIAAALAVEKTGQTLDDLLKLEEAVTMTQPELEKAVLGLSEGELHYAWGEPQVLLTDNWTEIWEAEGRRITVYFSHHGQAERIEKEETP